MFVLYYLRNTEKLFEVVVNLSTNKIDENVRLGSGVHSPADGLEIIKIEEICLKDEGVRAEIAKLESLEETVVISDP